MTKVTPFLMFNDQLEAAMEFYDGGHDDDGEARRSGPWASLQWGV